MQTLIIFWSSWHLELVVTKCQQDPPSYPLFIPSKPGQIRLLIKKSLWILPACHVMVYSKDILLQIWISWLSYLFLSPLLIHVAFSHLLVLGCWELERLVEQYSLIHWSAIHLEIFLKEIFETMAKFLEWFLETLIFLTSLLGQYLPLVFPTTNKAFVELKIG